MAQDIFSTLRTYASKVSTGEKSAAEVSAAFAAWAKESGGALKERAESEIETLLIKLGFVRSHELQPLLKRIADLEEIINGKVPASPKKKVSPSTVKKNVKKVAKESAAKGVKK